MTDIDGYDFIGSVGNGAIAGSMFATFIYDSPASEAIGIIIGVLFMGHQFLVRYRERRSKRE